MDDDLVALAVDQDDELEDVAGSVRPEDQPAIWVLAEIVDDEGVFDGVEHVVIGDFVAPSRVVDLHTDLSYYKTAP